MLSRGPRTILFDMVKKGCKIEAWIGANALAIGCWRKDSIPCGCSRVQDIKKIKVKRYCFIPGTLADWFFPQMLAWWFGSLLSWSDFSIYHVLHHRAKPVVSKLTKLSHHSQRRNVAGALWLWTVSRIGLTLPQTLWRDPNFFPLGKRDPLLGKHKQPNLTSEGLDTSPQRTHACVERGECEYSQMRSSHPATFSLDV